MVDWQFRIEAGMQGIEALPPCWWQRNSSVLWVGYITTGSPLAQSPLWWLDSQSLVGRDLVDELKVLA
jgi:hypothetical protein